MYTFLGNVTGCYKCTQREVGCHSNCKIYEDYKRKKDVINRRRQELRILEMRGCYNGR